MASEKVGIPQEVVWHGTRYVQFDDVMKWAYCQMIGADSINGLDCCDDFNDWLAALGVDLKWHTK